jgi:beta-glucosidase-like glycosyl hydrolase/cellulase/cellobiase CelA1
LILILKKKKKITKKKMKLNQKLLAISAIVAPMVNAFEIKTRLWSESEDLAKAFVEKMTLDEKIGMITGSKNSFGPCVGYIEPIERLDFKGMCLQDGPAGVRNANHSTTFPSGLNIASTFDPEIMKKLGVALGEECRAKGVNALLGPAMNMYRSPAAGRNWEGYGEDTYLASVTSKNVVAGVVSQGVLATVKHFAGNEQETRREHSNSVVDERVLQEVYFPPFKAAIVSGAGGVMAAYNDLNGIPAANNTWLLNKVLKKQMMFHGFVTSDWWGTKDKYEIMNGLDINMPGGTDWGESVTESYWGEELKASVESGEIDVSYVDDACVRIMTMLYKYRQFDDYPEINLDADATEGHAEIAREAAAASVVLLKNDEEILPISADKYKKIAIIGNGALPTEVCTDNGCKSQISGVVALGWGSGTTNMENISDPLSALTERAEKDGITITSFTEDDSDTEKAAEVAADADLAIVVVVADSGEGYLTVEGNSGDRKDLDLWHNGNDLVAAVAAANKNTVVVIYSPGVVNLPFLDDINGLVYAGMPGQEAGHGLADVLFNDVAPSGKLPFTWGKKREDYCCDIVPGRGNEITQVKYTEGYYIGYKWFDKEKIEPHFSFGHGLTYAKFKIHDDGQSYWNVQTQRLLNLINGISTTFTIENTSEFDGYVTPQAYLTMPSAKDDPRIGEYPEFQFKGFDKIFLKAGEKKKINLLVPYAETKYFNTTTNTWETTIDGKYKVSIGLSHDDIYIRNEVENYNKSPKPAPRYCFAKSDGYDCCFDNEVVYEDDSGKWGINDEGEWCGVEQPRWVPPPETTTTTKIPEPSIFGNPHNVYEDAEDFFVFPDYQKQVKSSYDKLIAEGETEVAEIVAKVARYPTPTWLANTAASKLVPKVLAQVTEQMKQTGKKILTSFIIYNLPNRDCSAVASRGELGTEHLGVYKEWIDEIAGYFAAHEGPIVAIIEPDALGNMVGNSNSELCAEAFETQMEALVYAITKLNLPNVSVYQDVAQVGWLGWGGNMRLLIPILEQLLNKVGTGVLRGFSSNISNNQPLTKPDPPEKTLSGCTSQSEYEYSLNVREALRKVGMVDFGWVVDTSRNGVPNIKTKGENWCNIKGAGIGRRPEATPEDLPGLDAVYWFKPPGESDGSDREGQFGYDPMCASEDSLTDSPRAGQWFHKQFVELAVNANPSFKDEPPFEFPEFEDEQPTTEVPEPTTTIVAPEQTTEVSEPTTTTEPTEPSCWAEALGYKCCSADAFTPVIFTDSDGDWSAENGEWCGILKSENTCWSKTYGYDCCAEGTAVYLEDESGKWGVTDDYQWCGIKN